MSAQAITAPIPRRFTRDEYDRMADSGFFVDERVELLDGEIISLAPQNPPHAGVTNQIASVLIPPLRATFSVRIQAPIVLNDWSEPEPDIAICRLDPANYQRAHPKAGDVLLVIEVASSSLAYDRSRKVAAYAASSIPEYWIMNLTDRWIETRSDPDPVAQRYRQERRVLAGDTLVLPGGATLAASDIVPRY